MESARRAALALPLAQAGLGLAGSGALALTVGRPAAMAFLAGAAVIALGYAVFGWRTALRSPIAPASRAFLRLIVGALLKWLVIGAGLALAMTAADWPTEFVLGGAVSAFLAYVICLPWLLR